MPLRVSRAKLVYELRQYAHQALLNQEKVELAWCSFFFILWHQFCYKRSLVMAVADLGFKSRVVEEKMNMLYRV